MNDPVRPPGGPNTVFLIDGNNFLFRAYHALPMLNAPDGTPVNAVHGFVRMIQALRRDFEPEYIVAVFDAGGRGFRNELFEDYKANRSPPPDDLVPQFALTRAAIDALGIKRVEQRGVEADDLIATFAVRAQREGKTVVIVSSDKDLMQMVDVGAGRESIVLYDTMKGMVIHPEQVEAKFGVGPDRLGDLLALTGDSSDNIPGVPGIGPKTAAALLTDFGDLEGVLTHAGELKQKKRRERLVEHADDARLSRKLVELDRNITIALTIEDMRDPGAEQGRVQAFFEPLGFKMVLKEAGGESKVARGTEAQDTRQSEGAIELQPLHGFVTDRDRYSVLLAADGEAFRATVAELRKAQRLAFRLATSSNNAMRADILGVALAGDSITPCYVPVAHRALDLPPGHQLNIDEVLAELRPVFEDERVAKIADGHKSQSIVLARNDVDLRGVVMDPMLASYSLDPARTSHSLEALAADLLGHKCITPDQVMGKGKRAVGLDEVPVDAATKFLAERAELAFVIGRHLEGEIERAGAAAKKLFSTIELPLATVLRRIELRGIELDAAVLRSQSEQLGRTIAEIQQRVDAEAGYSINIDSPIQLQKLLFDERGLPATKKTKTGYSTDARVLEELSLIDPIVREILEYRSLTKLKGTYLDTLPTLVHPETGRLHSSFRQAVAQTGRLSSQDPNIQNIPVRTEHGRRIREAFVAPGGRRLVALDYSQIELRILAHLSKDPNLVSAFREDVDVHRRTAAEVFGVDEASVDASQRRIAKAVNFGVIYGQTAFGLAQQLGIPRGKAGSYIRAYFERIPGVDRYMTKLVERAKARGYAETLLGRRRRIPELRRKGPARGHGERIARNTPIQGSAADILKIAMIEVERALDGRDFAEMLLTVHDELIFECDEDRVDDLIAIARPLMEHAFELSVPLKVDFGSGRTWADCKG